MAIILTKPKQPTKINDALPLSLHADAIDVCGAEAAALAALETQIKVLQDKAKPLQARQKALLLALSQQMQEDGVDADKADHIERGEKYQVVLGKQSATRRIADMEQCVGCLGEEAFLKCATVTMKDIDQYTSKIEQESFLEIVRGNREGKLSLRAE